MGEAGGVLGDPRDMAVATRWIERRTGTAVKCGAASILPELREVPASRRAVRRSRLPVPMNPVEQLVLDLVPPEPPTFASFLVGRNAEAVAALTRFAAGDAAEPR